MWPRTRFPSQDGASLPVRTLTRITRIICLHLWMSIKKSVRYYCLYSHHSDANKQLLLFLGCNFNTNQSTEFLYVAMENEDCRSPDSLCPFSLVIPTQIIFLYENRKAIKLQRITWGGSCQLPFEFLRLQSNNGALNRK